MDYIIKNFDKISIAVFIVRFTSWITWHRWKKTRRITACDKYHSAILHTLEGIYPDTTNWKTDINDRLKQSIPAIELAVTEFQRFITYKTDIDNTLQNYKNCCYETTDNKCTKFIMYPEKGEVSPKEIFKSKVEALLEFTKKT